MSGRLSVIVSGTLSLLLAALRYHEVRAASRWRYALWFFNVVMAALLLAYRFTTYPQQRALAESRGRPAPAEWSVVANKLCTLGCVVLMRRYPSRTAAFRFTIWLVSGAVFLLRRRALLRRRDPRPRHTQPLI